MGVEQTWRAGGQTSEFDPEWTLDPSPFRNNCHRFLVRHPS